MSESTEHSTEHSTEPKSGPKDELIEGLLTSSPAPLRERSTLAVGGAPRFAALLSSEDELRAVCRWAMREGLELYPIGGGSNILCADEGLEGLALSLSDQELSWEPSAEESGVTLVTAGAGLEWDELVAWSVARGLAGIECLSGIPGQVGAAPIQNIGAYGQELSDCCVGVRVYDSLRDELSWWGPERCAWSYRDSAFKRHPRRFIVLKLRLALREGGAPTLRYEQLTERLGPTPSLAELRAELLRLRASKSMVYDPSDPNHRSAGSFFLNPILSPQEMSALERRAVERSLPSPPRWREGLGFKVPAAWLIERAGCPKGYGEGRAGLSSAHCLALINRGGASASELINLAREVQLKVHERFGLWLQAEVNLWGFQSPQLAPVSSSLQQPSGLELRGGRRPRVALASCAQLPPWERDDEPLIAALRARGLEVERPQWRDPLVEWSRYDLVIPRTTWDYQESPEAFLAWLTQVEAQSALANDAEVIRWNLNKRYLQDLEALGATTPATRWIERVNAATEAPSAEELRVLCDERGWRRAFLKPTVAANAWGTARFDCEEPEELERASALLRELLTERSFILQPYYEGVETEGELSMIFFGGRFSHAVQKVPKAGDYRVQDDHGASDRPWSAPAAWIERAQRLLSALPYELLYARVDCLRGADGAAHLIELELIEPSLFFRHDQGAGERLAELIAQRLRCAP